jgi:hypothetical protein
MLTALKGWRAAGFLIDRSFIYHFKPSLRPCRIVPGEK